MRPARAVAAKNKDLFLLLLPHDAGDAIEHLGVFSDRVANILILVEGNALGSLDGLPDLGIRLDVQRLGFFAAIGLNDLRLPFVHDMIDRESGFDERFKFTVLDLGISRSELHR